MRTLQFKRFTRNKSEKKLPASIYIGIPSKVHVLPRKKLGKLSWDKKNRTKYSTDYKPTVSVKATKT